MKTEKIALKTASPYVDSIEIALLNVRVDAAKMFFYLRKSLVFRVIFRVAALIGVEFVSSMLTSPFRSETAGAAVPRVGNSPVSSHNFTKQNRGTNLGGIPNLSGVRGRSSTFETRIIALCLLLFLFFVSFRIRPISS